MRMQQVALEAPLEHASPEKTKEANAVAPRWTPNDGIRLRNCERVPKLRGSSEQDEKRKACA